MKQNDKKQQKRWARLTDNDDDDDGDEYDGE